MNIQSITMGEALETLAQQGRIIPTIMFQVRDPESFSVGYGTEEESFPDVTRSEDSELPQQDELEEEDNLDRFFCRRSEQQDDNVWG